MIIPPILSVLALLLAARALHLIEAAAADGGVHQGQFLACAIAALLAIRTALRWQAEFAGTERWTRLNRRLERIPTWAEATAVGLAAWFVLDAYGVAAAGNTQWAPDAEAAAATFFVHTALWILPLACALSMHEWAHARAACALGDSTAKDRGRMTLNPLSHFSFLGLVLVPLLMRAIGLPFVIGWANPVPVDFERLDTKRWHGAAVALAGPACNLVGAFAISSLLRALPEAQGAIGGFVSALALRFVLVSLVLALFNLLPIPPLDGGRVLIQMLPAPWRRALRARERAVILVGIAAVMVIANSQGGLSARLDGAIDSAYSLLVGQDALHRADAAAHLSPEATAPTGHGAGGGGAEDGR